jgi:hypothetical protein
LQDPGAHQRPERPACCDKRVDEFVARDDRRLQPVKDFAGRQVHYIDGAVVLFLDFLEDFQTSGIQRRAQIFLRGEFVRVEGRNGE